MSGYVCRVCGQPWHTPYVRCIGTDGDHAPTFPVAREDSSRFSARIQTLIAWGCTPHEAEIRATGEGF